MERKDDRTENCHIGLEIIIAALALVVVGDYLGYKIGHRRVASVAGIIAGVVIVIFVIYAAIMLARS